MKKFLSILLVMVLVVAFCACQGTTHACESKCEECGKCTDTACTEDACKDKCEGHEPAGPVDPGNDDPDTPTPPAHTCESKCPTCGKCTDAACTEDACKDKCAGHEPKGEEVVINGETYYEADPQNVVFIATWTENARGTGDDKYKVAAKNAQMLVFVDFDCAHSDAGLQAFQHRYTWIGEGGTEQFNNLVGLPVNIEVVTRDEEKTVTDEEGNESTVMVTNYYVTKLELQGEMISDYANKFAAADGKYYYNGTEIGVDEAKFAWDENHNSARAWVKAMGGAWTANSSSARFFNHKTDEKLTFVDTDKDGKYDWAREMRSVNGLILNETYSFEDVALAFKNLGFGSNENNGWWNGDGKYFAYIKGDESFDLNKAIEEGKFINAIAHHDSEMGTTMVGAINVLLEIYICDEITGVMTANNGYDDRFDNKTITIDGVEYNWSSQIRQTDGADGEGGKNAGRKLMTEANIGKTVRAVFDMAGNVIYVEIVETGEENPGEEVVIPEYPTDVYLILATYNDNARVGDSLLCKADEPVAAVMYGDALTDKNASKYQLSGAFTGTLERGKLYKLTITGNEIEAAEELKGISLPVGMFSYDEATKTAKNGDADLPLDTYALVGDEYAKHGYIWNGAKFSTFSPVDRSSYKEDDILTFIDTNGDGKYDFCHLEMVLNGIVGEVTADGRVEIVRSVGSTVESGWYQPSNYWYFNAPEGVSFSSGDMISFTVTINPDTDYESEGFQNPNRKRGIPPVLNVLSVCKKVSGAVTEVVKGEGNKDITFKLDGVEYTWSNRMIANATYGDGENGANANRDKFADGTWTIFCDNAGFVVYAVQ